MDLNAPVYFGQVPISWALQCRRPAIAKMLIETGQLNLDVDEDVGRTPLWWAAAVGNDEAMKLMLGTGHRWAKISAFRPEGGGNIS